MGKPIVTCDHCPEKFEIVYQSTLNGEVEKMFFVCPHCGHSYTVSYTDSECRRMQRKIQHMQEKLGERMDHLKATYEPKPDATGEPETVQP